MPDTQQPVMDDPLELILGDILQPHPAFVASIMVPPADVIEATKRFGWWGDPDDRWFRVVVPA